MKHDECKYCPYWDQGKCMIATWLDPEERPKRDINLCLAEAHQYEQLSRPSPNNDAYPNILGW